MLIRFYLKYIFPFLPSLLKETLFRDKIIDHFEGLLLNSEETKSIHKIISSGSPYSILVLESNEERVRIQFAVRHQEINPGDVIVRQEFLTNNPDFTFARSLETGNIVYFDLTVDGNLRIRN